MHINKNYEIIYLINISVDNIINKWTMKSGTFELSVFLVSTGTDLLLLNQSANKPKG